MKNFKGVFTALITPFKNGKIDYTSLSKVIEFQLDNGIDGFIISGTTGESPTLSEKEKVSLFKFVQKQAPHKVLILGTGSNCTQKTIQDTQLASALGADAALVVVPYYNKPPQHGLYEHFSQVARKTSIPIILYNVPGRTVTSLSVETIFRLSKVKNIIGIKEATGNIDFAKQIIKKCGEKFIMLSGDDGSYVDFLLAGGHGVISVASHVIPLEMCLWTDLVKNNQNNDARKEAKKYKKLIDLLFIESNPIPVKNALKQMNLIKSAELRLPLVEMQTSLSKKLVQEMISAGVL